MSNSKNYNSIVFLTTLSVYLGLVLIGGTPPVLAHAALTQQFDIQNELEVKDDLDKKPDENDLLAQSILGIINDLDRFSKLKEFNWEAESTISVEELNFCESDNSPAYGGSYSPNISQKISGIIENRDVQIGRNLNKLKSDFGLGNFYQGYPEGISFNLSTENKALSLEIKVNIKSDDISQKFFNLVDSSISRKKSSTQNLKLAVIYQNTTVTFKDNQVFIVTRLPRGSLDALLANKDAR